nr:odorant binding protein 13 [Graphosoma rubrolineatum]
MALCGLLVLATCILGAVAVPVRDDPIAFKNATWEKCKRQENVPDDAMKDLYFFKSVEGIKDHKCVIKCIDEEYGILQKDETISKEMILQAIKENWQDQQVQDKLISGTDKCMESVNPGSDVCQYTFDIFDCFLQVLKKEGITTDQEKTN